jgi:hypothetical protein
MPNKKNFKEKTYNRCLSCDHRGVSCNGPRTSDMTLERWREFMRDMKDVEGLTYAEISDRTNPKIPARTIEKKLSPGGDGQDMMRETARPSRTRFSVRPRTLVTLLSLRRIRMRVSPRPLWRLKSHSYTEILRC